MRVKEMEMEMGKRKGKKEEEMEMKKGKKRGKIG